MNFLFRLLCFLDACVVGYKSAGEGVSRAGVGAIRAAQDFQYHQ